MRRRRGVFATVFVTLLMLLFVLCALYGHDESGVIIATPIGGQSVVTSNTALLWGFYTARGQTAEATREWDNPATVTQWYTDGTSSICYRTTARYLLQIDNRTSYYLCIGLNTGRQLIRTSSGTATYLHSEWNETTPTLNESYYFAMLGPPASTTCSWQLSLRGRSGAGGMGHDDEVLFPIYNVGVFIVPDDTAKTSATIQAEVTSGPLGLRIYGR